MSWQCRLYGHQWRHPGEYEVVLVGDTEPAYPFECAVCGNEMLVDAIGSGPTDEVDVLPTDTGPELETAPESDVGDESTDR